MLLSSLLFSTMSYSIMSLKEPTYQFMDDANLEDFTIEILPTLTSSELNSIENGLNGCTATPSYIGDLNSLHKDDNVCYNYIISLRENEIETKYDTSLEKRELKVVSGEHSVRFVNNMTTMNISFYEEGKAPSTDNEIAINKYYADSNNLSIGDIYQVNDKDYTISGYLLLSDYTLPMLGGSFIIDNTKQTFAVTTDSEYNNIAYNSFSVHFSVDESEDQTEVDELIKEMNDDIKASDAPEFMTQKIISSKDEMRSGGIVTELEGGASISYGLSIMLTGVAIIIIAIVIGQIVRKERSQIGLLKALGFDTNQIIKPYLFVLSIISIPVLIIGYFIGIVLATPMAGIYQAFYIIPSQATSFNLSLFIQAVLVPLIFLNLLVFIIIKRLLRETPLEMQKPKVDKDNFIVRFISKRYKGDIKKKFKYLLSFKSLSKISMFAFSILLSSLLLLFGLSLSVNMDKMMTGYYDNAEYNYIGYCNGVCDTSLEENAEYAIHLPGLKLEDESFTLVGLEDDSELHPIYKERAFIYGTKDITSEINDKDVVITKSLSVNTGYKKGDTLTTKINDQEISLNIIAVDDNYTSNSVYMDRDALVEEVDSITDPDFANVVYSLDELDDSNYASTVSVDDILSQSESMAKFSTISFIYLIGASISFGILILYIIISFIVEDNFYAVSMLKVFGFNKEEIDDIVLKSYDKYTTNIYIVSLIYVIILLFISQSMMADMFNIVLPIAPFNIINIIIAFVVTKLIFKLSSRSGKKKLENISLQESLKLYQE